MPERAAVIMDERDEALVEIGGPQRIDEEVHPVEPLGRIAEHRAQELDHEARRRALELVQVRRLDLEHPRRLPRDRGKAPLVRRERR